MKVKEPWLVGQPCPRRGRAATEIDYPYSQLIMPDCLVRACRGLSLAGLPRQMRSGH